MADSLLLLRVGRRARWSADRRAEDPEHVVEAALDLTLAPDEAGLSVYRVEGDEDSREVALRYALTSRKKVDHMDYLVFPSGLATSLGLSVKPVPAQGLDPELNARHHEIIGLTPDLKKRLVDHQDGRSPHTAKFAPWLMVAYFAFVTENTAMAFEKYLKSGSGRVFAKRHLWPNKVNDF